MADTSQVLEFAQVVKRRWDGTRELLVLDGVSFEIGRGTFVGLYGARRSGKSTVLRLAAGLDLADEGRVAVAGCDLASASAVERARLLRGVVALVAPDSWRARPQESLVDHLVLSLGCDGITATQARRRAYSALDEVGLAGVGLEPTASLPMVERLNLMLARALLHTPELLLIDEPSVIPSVSGRERFGKLLRELARARNLAVIVASEELAAVQGSSVLMSLGAGQLTSTDERGVVVHFPGRQRAAGERVGA